MPLLSTFGAASARSFGGIGAAAAGAGLDIDDAFSTYVYEGTSGSSLSINNGIDLSGEGGLVWTKERSSGGGGHILFSTDASGNHSGLLVSSSTAAAGTGYQPTYFTFNNNGYTTTNTVGDSKVNGNDYVSWAFKNTSKFFDVVTYTGTGSAQNISHNLGSVPGMILVKKTNGVVSWNVFHRSLGATKVLFLNTTNEALTQTSRWNDTEPTSTQFTVGTSGGTNDSGDTYVAYLFAHNNSDGEFGPDSDQDVIKCGSYTGNGSTTGPSINLGFEPQFLMIKKYSGGTGSWEVVDIMRGFPVDTAGDRVIRWNSSGSENTGDALPVGKPTATGFQILTDEGHVNQSGHGYIYMAIRRGPLAEPESATNVFAIDQENSSAPYYTSNFPVDMGFIRRKDNTSSWYIYDRLRQGKELVIDTSATEGAAGNAQFDYMDGFSAGAFASDAFAWMWKRAPGYFDVVAYTGNSTNNTEIKHNLGVVPEMVWTKQRTTDVRDWSVYHSVLGNNNTLTLNTTALAEDNSAGMHATPTATSLFLKASNMVNANGQGYIAYLFATLAGVSKVGSYTGNGSSQTIDCGFSSGARFVLIKSSTQATEWNVFDTARGIVSGNDPALFLDNTSAEVTNGDFIDPHSSGFTINYVTTLQGCNTSGQSYIFYAIA